MSLLYFVCVSLAIVGYTQVVSSKGNENPPSKDEMQNDILRPVARPRRSNGEMEVDAAIMVSLNKTKEPTSETKTPLIRVKRKARRQKPKPKPRKRRPAPKRAPKPKRRKPAPKPIRRVKPIHKPKPKPPRKSANLILFQFVSKLHRKMELQLDAQDIFLGQLQSFLTNVNKAVENKDEVLVKMQENLKKCGLFSCPTKQHDDYTKLFQKDACSPNPCGPGNRCASITKMGCYPPGTVCNHMRCGPGRKKPIKKRNPSSKDILNSLRSMELYMAKKQQSIKSKTMEIFPKIISKIQGSDGKCFEKVLEKVKENMKKCGKPECPSLGKYNPCHGYACKKGQVCVVNHYGLCPPKLPCPPPHSCYDKVKACKPNPCNADQVCKREQLCPQAICIKFYCKPKTAMPSPCDPNPCGRGSVCEPTHFACDRAPCPQYMCKPSALCFL